MEQSQLFGQALGLSSPWKITDVEFTSGASGKALHISIDFARGTKFQDDSAAACDVHDTKQKTWRHLNFFEHAYYLHCRTPRIKPSFRT